MYDKLDSFREGGVTGVTISADCDLASFLRVPFSHEFSQSSLARRAVKCLC